MKNAIKVGAVLVGLGAATVGRTADRTAGNVLVDVRASAITGVTPGDRITTWANAGSMNDFTARGTGPTYQLRDGVPVVRFDGTAAGCLTNCLPGEVPAAILGNNPWTMEAWVFSEKFNGSNAYLSWTASGSYGEVAEFRLSSEIGWAVEHYTSTTTSPYYCMKWGDKAPTAGEWHHIVCVRQANSTEHLFLDGRMVWIYNDPSYPLKLKGDGPMMLGGVLKRTNMSNPANLFSGDIAKLRVTDAALPTADIVANFLDDAATFGRTPATDIDATLIDGVWTAGVGPTDGRGLSIVSGETTLTDFQGALPYIRQTGGKVTFAGATDVAVVSRDTLDYERLQDEFAAPAEFALTGGMIAFSNYMHMGMCTSGKFTVGGTDTPALVCGPKEMGFGHFAPGGTTEVNVLTNGTIRNGTGWMRFGSGSNTVTRVTIEAGGLVDADQILAGGWGGTAYVTVRGTMRSRIEPLGVGEASDSLLTIERGGLVQARGLCEWGNTTVWNDCTGVSRLHVNGGTVELYPVAKYAKSVPLLNTVMRVTYENEMTVDVPTGGETYILAAITNLTSAGVSSRFVKRGGGTLTFDAPLDGLTGDVYVEAGLLTFKRKFPEGADVRIHVAKGACVSADINGGGASSLLPFIAMDSEGAIGVHGYDKNEDLVMSDHSELAVRFLGTSDYAGRITPHGNHYIFEATGATGVYRAAIADADGVPAHVTVRAVPGVSDNAYVKLTGNNAGMTGGVTVETGAKLWLAHASAAGSDGAVKLETGTTLCLNAAVGADFLTARVTDDSRPDQIFLLAGAEAVNVDLSRFPGCHLGTEGGVSVNQTGTVRPDGDVYLLGGGATPHAGSNTGLRPGTLADVDGGTPTTVVVDRDGMINLSNTANTYSGGTVVTNGARVFTTADGFGALPETFDEKNIYLNNGVLRTGNATFSLPATRGIWVDELGATFYPWSPNTFTVLGGLGGTGAIAVTDKGNLTFAGEHNTYSGKMSVSVVNVITIGDGEHFSWASGEIATASGGRVVLDNDGAATFAGLVSGAGALEKVGTGTLTISRAQTFTGTATVGGGTLSLTGDGAITAASKIVNNGAIVIDRAPSAAFGAKSVTGSGTVTVVADDGRDVTVDRAVGTPLALSARNGATLTSPALGSNGTAVEVVDATFRTGVTAAGHPGGDFTAFQLNGNATLIATNDLRLTEQKDSQAGSAFWKTRINATRPWEASFTYAVPNCPSSPADGFAFLLQNSAAGAAGIGGYGGSIGALGLTPALGVAFNVFNNDSIGWIYDNAKKDMAGTSNKALVQSGMYVRVQHDGFGKLTTMVRSTNSTDTFNQSKVFDIGGKLGGSTAYVGFTGATGGAKCEQHIRDFSFVQASDIPDFTLTNANWHCVSNAVVMTYNGLPAVRLTENKGYQDAAATYRNRFYLQRPFRITGTWVMTASSAKSADGCAFVFHNDRVDSIGTLGGSRGFGGGIAGENMPTCAGWAFNVYNSTRLDFVKNAAVSTQYSNLNGVSLTTKNAPVDFEIAYAPGTLSIALKQTISGAVKTFCTTQAVDLAEMIGSSFGYFALTAATGGSSAEMWVYDLGYATDSEKGVTDGYDGISFAGTSALEVTGVAAGNAAAAFADVVVADGADVTVRTLGAANVPYEVTFGRVSFARDGGAAPALTLAANGDAAGTLKLGTVVADLARRPLKIVGALAPANGKIRIEVPEFRGAYRVLDLTEATGVTVDDFELVTPTKPPFRLRLENGYLSVGSTGLSIYVR